MQSLQQRVSEALSSGRSRGRPRLNNVRVECMIPREAYEQLVAAETRTNVYRTRVAANVIC